MSGWNKFFHSRFGASGLKLVGWMRICFGALILIDRICFLPDADFLLSPSGVLNFLAAQQNPLVSDDQLTLFSLFPESEGFFWGLYYLGMVQSVLLMLGILPKFQLACLYVNLVSFQHHNHMMWDGEDRMFKLWAFLFLFFPMHTVTIFDSFGKKLKSSTETWPMWPVRLFQLEMTLVYMGASLSKATSRSWAEGTAMYWISYTTDYYPGVFNPDFLFNRLWPLKIFCWSAIVLETCGWSLVWIKPIRKIVVALMFALHIGIDLTMNMYCFEWLALIGWTLFLIEPLPTAPKEAFVTKKDDDKPAAASGAEAPTPTAGSRILRQLANLLVVALLTAFSTDAFPVEDIQTLAPAFAKPFLGVVEYNRAALYDAIEPWLNRLALQQGVWTMYTGEYPDSSNCYYHAELYYTNETMVEWESPDWMAMPWWERKMRMRLMNYYDSGETAFAAASWVEFAKFLQKDKTNADEEAFVGTVTMYLRCDEGVEMEEDVGWFDPVRQPMEEFTIPMMTVDVCRDDFDECGKWKEDDLCETEPESMKLYCQQTCELCEDYIVTWPDRETARWYHPQKNDLFVEMYHQYPPPGGDDPPGGDEL